MLDTLDKSPDTSRPKVALIVGMGNIGSGLAPMLARSGIERMALVDFDVYEERNLPCQDITASDVGRAKVVVQANRLRRINPAIDVRAFRCRVEGLPLALLWSADVIVSCLDSRISRQYLSQAAWHLGVSLIDGAVDASDLLARVNVYVPGPDSICMECGWDDDDYNAAALEQPYPCEVGGGRLAPTSAPASLGLVTAGLMAVECQKLLAGDQEQLLAGRQVMLELRHHTQHVTAFQRRHCRFDHEIWHVEQLDKLPSKLTLGQILRFVADGSGHSSNCALRVEGEHFAAMQYCAGCGHHEAIPLHLADRIPSVRRRCTACGQMMTVRGFDMRAWIDSQALARQDLARPLSSLGVQPGDVLSVRSDVSQRHFILSASSMWRTASGLASNRRQATSQGDKP